MKKQEINIIDSIKQPEVKAPAKKKRRKIKVSDIILYFIFFKNCFKNVLRYIFYSMHNT